MKKVIDWLVAKVLGLYHCPCGNWVDFNDGWNKWENCGFCGYNPNQNYYAGFREEK